MCLRTLKESLDKLNGQFDQITSELSDTENKLSQTATELLEWEEVRNIVQFVAQKTQETLQYHISELASLGLASVFDNPYKFVVEFVTKRGKTEASLQFERDGNIIDDPIEDSGFGPVDVASVALRASLWPLCGKTLRPVLFLDEPFKHLSVDLQDKAMQFISEVSKKMGLQIVIISHVPDSVAHADRVFYVSNNNGTSHVKI